MSGRVRSSVGLLWRHQRLVWWIFAVNLALAWLGSLPARMTLSKVLDHSLESARLVTGFDVSTLVLMLERPDVQARTMASGAVGATLVFLVYLLFIDGGVVTVFLDDRKLSKAEFFESSGLYFWRMVRLALYSVIPFGLLVAAGGGIAGYAGKLASDAPQERLGFFVNVASKVVLLVAALFVRMCFDLAQANVVQDNERKVMWTLGRSIGLAFRSGKLFASYLGIGLYAMAVLAVGLGVCVYVPHSAMLLTFVILELVTIKLITARLWMKAASARWVGLVPAPVVPAGEAPVQVEVPDVPSAE